ncbi:hypothetical protein CC86DRAFT_313931 [Ophiobolus disseminans]|uniref:BED-type domain-containing protein n=1 Tax=Ophiobolus disseminans TaxID=1469910 RepID=A0A6A7AHF1_9PLEO|nr:hypothetical protein CC86DRAFT_313931 [Ophiobolus disseminans]
MSSVAPKRCAPLSSSRVAKRRKAPSQRPSQRLSQRPSLSLSPLAAASQATTFETQLLESQLEAEIAQPDGSELGTVATTEAGDRERDGDDSDSDNFNSIDWARLKGFIKPLTTQRRGVKSWIFRHGYRVVKRNNLSKIWFVCKHCYTHKVIDASGGGLFDVTKATSAAANYLS